MDLTARDVHEKQFHDAWRGYNQEEVDDFLDRIAEVLDRIQRENSALHNRLKELEQAVATSREAEEMLKKTLVTAQQAAEEAIAKAKAKAEQLVTDAEERTKKSRDEARERVATAEAEARRKTLEAEAEIRRRQAEAEREHNNRKRELDTTIERLQAFETELKQKLRTFLDQQKSALDSLNETQRPKAASQSSDKRETTPRPTAGSWTRDPLATRPHPTVDVTDATAPVSPDVDRPARDHSPAQPAAPGREREGGDGQDAAPQRRGVRGLFTRDET